MNGTCIEPSQSALSTWPRVDVPGVLLPNATPACALIGGTRGVAAL